MEANRCPFAQRALTSDAGPAETQQPTTRRRSVRVAQNEAKHAIMPRPLAAEEVSSDPESVSTVLAQPGTATMAADST